MQSKAIEGVPCRAHAHHSLLIFLSLSSFACVGRTIHFSLSPSAHVDLIYADYFTITIDHPRVERKREREEKEHELHT
jgi:hypothetical protein